MCEFFSKTRTCPSRPKISRGDLPVSSINSVHIYTIKTQLKYIYASVCQTFSASAPLSTIYPRYRPPPESLNILLNLYLFNDNKDYLLV